MTTVNGQKGTAPDSGAPTYQVRVAGHLDDRWTDWLGVDRLARSDDLTTTLTLQSADQAQLHGLLTRVRDLGATLLSLHTVDPAPRTRPATPVLAHTLHTARLTLRPATARDANATWAYRRLDRVNEWLAGTPADPEDYRRMFVQPSRLSTTVIVELTQRGEERQGVLIGDFMLRRDDAWAQAEVTEQAKGAQVELGWVLDPAYTGAGYATEATRELLRYSFEELSVHRVVANCFVANEASWLLMERVGMRRETHAVAESLHRSNRWLDTVAYAILRREWTRGATESA